MVQQTANEMNASNNDNEPGWNDLAPVDVIELNVGYRLISRVVREQGVVLIERAKAGRLGLSQAAVVDALGIALGGED